MGQPVKFLSTSSPRSGIVRFELNRTVTGMGHERYRADEEIIGTRFVDELAKRLLALNKFTDVHIYGSVVTAVLKSNSEFTVQDSNNDFTAQDLQTHDLAMTLNDAITDLYTYYKPGS